MELKKSKVQFTEETHEYHLDGVLLGGVTPIVKWVYPDTYKDIDDDVLRRAAERGTQVHRDCQLLDCGIDVGSDEVKAYRDLKEANGLVTAYNEWLVDDGWGNIASKIDVIFEDGSIGDIKATSQIHVDNVTLQLSIYAYLLEGMNQGLHVPRICVIWLPRKRYGTPKLMWLDRIPTVIIDKVLYLYSFEREGGAEDARKAIEDWKARQCPKMKETDIAAFVDAEKEVVRLETMAKEIKKQQETLRRGLLELMEKYGQQSYNGELINIVRTSETTTTTLDAKALKAEMPDIYEKYARKSTRKGSITIKIK